MTHRPSRSLRLSALLVLGLATATSSAWAGGIDKLRAFVSGTQSASGEFSQTVVSRSGRKPQKATGSMVFSRPGKFRWEYLEPYPQLLVGDGETLWMWDKDLNQVTRRKIAAALGGTPAAILAGSNDLDKNFSLSEGGNQDGLDWVEATPRAADASFQKVRIGFAGTALKAMELFDNLGQQTSVVFSNMKANPAVAADTFRFTPPKGADVLAE